MKKVTKIIIAAVGAGLAGIAGMVAEEAFSGFFNNDTDNEEKTEEVTNEEEKEEIPPEDVTVED